MDLVGEQGTLFPLSRFEPITTTLKELADYARQQRELTSRFAERDRKRDAELDRLIAAANNDLSPNWQEALNRLADTADTGPEFTIAGRTTPATTRTGLRRSWSDQPNGPLPDSSGQGAVRRCY